MTNLLGRYKILLAVLGIVAIVTLRSLYVSDEVSPATGGKQTNPGQANLLAPQQRSRRQLLTSLLSVDQQDMNTFIDALDAQQRTLDRDSCSGGRVLLWPGFMAGMGTQLHILSYNLALALASDRTLVITGNTVYAHDGCQDKTLQCFLENISSCKADDYPDFEDGELDDPEAAFSTKQIVRINLLKPFDLNMHDIGLQKPHSIYWYTRELISYIVQPNHALREATKEIKELSGINDEEPFISLHIRHGDKEATQHAFGDYLRPLQNLRDFTAIRKIYLSSDNPAAYEAIPKLLPEFDVAFIPPQLFIDAQGAELAALLEAGEAPNGSYDEGTLMMANMLTMRQGAYFVGTISSNVGRIVYELMDHCGTGMPPFLDVAGEFWYAETYFA